jgi:hypothetical protein
MSGRRLVRLARLLFRGPEDVESEATRSVGALARDQTVGSGLNLWRLDEVEAAHVGALAASIALDARRMPELVAEHLGLDPGFSLDLVQQELDRAIWQKRDRRLNLVLDTAHPAIHSALSDVVSRVERHRRWLEVGGKLDSRVSELLPTAILSGGLVPSLDDWNQPLFDPLHLRFTLDQARIIRLLMGEELYGDPKLALRELSQNALDACRYRRARQSFLLTQQGRDRNVPPARIILEAGISEGRPYLACEDNGIGMGERHFRELFTRAGRRFTDTYEYHLDLAQWIEADIPFWPNSRFGIGVLSYFMLAEEIRIETRRLEQEGALASEGLVGRVTGSGSLFRLRRDTAIRPAGGTRITLVLKDTTADPDSFLESVLEWLWLPEAESILRWSRRARYFRQPDSPPAGIPTEACKREFGTLLPISTSANSLGQPRLFWAPDYWRRRQREDRARYTDRTARDVVLVDGLRSSALAPPALLINLNDDLRGQVSVDRRSVEIGSDSLAWIGAKLQEDQGSSLLAWEGARSADLAELAVAHPLPLISFDANLRTAGIDAPSENFICLGHSVSLNGLGLSIADKFLGAGLEGAKIDPGLSRLAIVRLVELLRAGVHMPESWRQFATLIQDRLPIRDIRLSTQLIVSQATELCGRSDTKPGILNLAQATLSLGLPLSRLSEANEFCALGIADCDRNLLFRLAESPQSLERVLQAIFTGAVGASDTKFTLAHLLGARLSAVSPADITDAVQHLVELGLAEIDAKQFARCWPPSTDALRVLSIDLDGLAKFSRKLTEAILLGATYGLVKTPGEVADLARTLTGVVPVEADLDAFAQRPPLSGGVATAMAQILPSRFRSSANDAPYRILTLARGLVLQADERRELAQALATMGWISDDAATVAALLELSEESIALFNPNNKTTRKDQPQIISPLDASSLLQTVLLTELAPSVVAALATPLVEHELVDVSLDVFAALPAPSALLRRIISPDSDTPPFDPRLSLPHLLGAALYLSKTCQEIADEVEPLHRLGLIDLDLARFAQLSPPGLPALIALAYPEQELSRQVVRLDTAMLYGAAVASGLSPAEIAEMWRPIIELGLIPCDFSCEPAHIAALGNPNRLARILLSKDLDGKGPWRTSLDAFDLANAARKIGVPVRDLAPSVSDMEKCGIEVGEARAFVDFCGGVGTVE